MKVSGAKLGLELSLEEWTALGDLGGERQASGSKEQYKKR